MFIGNLFALVPYSGSTHNVTLANILERLILDPDPRVRYNVIKHLEGENIDSFLQKIKVQLTNSIAAILQRFSEPEMAIFVEQNPKDFKFFQDMQDMSSADMLFLREGVMSHVILRPIAEVFAYKLRFADQQKLKAYGILHSISRNLSHSNLVRKVAQESIKFLNLRDRKQRLAEFFKKHSIF